MMGQFRPVSESDFRSRVATNVRTALLAVMERRVTIAKRAWPHLGPKAGVRKLRSVLKGQRWLGPDTITAIAQALDMDPGEFYQTY